MFLVLSFSVLHYLFALFFILRWVKLSYMMLDKTKTKWSINLFFSYLCVYISVNNPWRPTFCLPLEICQRLPVVSGKRREFTPFTWVHHAIYNPFKAKQTKSRSHIKLPIAAWVTLPLVMRRNESTTDRDKRNCKYLVCVSNSPGLFNITVAMSVALQITHRVFYLVASMFFMTCKYKMGFCRSGQIMQAHVFILIMGQGTNPNSASLGNVMTGQQGLSVTDRWL